MRLLKNTSGFLAYAAGVLFLLVTIVVLASYEMWEKIPYLRLLITSGSARKLSQISEAEVLHQL